MATFARIPPAARLSPTWVLAALGLYTAGAALWFFSPAFPLAPLRDLQSATGHWVQVTLIASCAIGLGQLVFLFGPGGQRASDVGWRAGALPAGLAAAAVLWTAMNLSTMVTAVVGGGPLAWHPDWSRGGLLPGALIAQLLGTALMEETVFRAWLWPQLAARFGQRMSARDAGLSALLASQALFALLHIPVRVAGGASPVEVAMAVLGLFLVGLVFAILYAATRNLFFVVGVHALGNAPTLLFEPQGPAPSIILLGASLGLAAVWGWRGRSHARRAPSPFAPLMHRA